MAKGQTTDQALERAPDADIPDDTKGLLETLNDPTQEDHDAFHRRFCISKLRDAMASAILQNPSVERFVYGNPLERRRVADHPTIGAYLAHECDRLAGEFYDAAHTLDLARMPKRETAPDDSANVAITD